jgi:hypothetical protein
MARFLPIEFFDSNLFKNHSLQVFKDQSFFWMGDGTEFGASSG